MICHRNLCEMGGFKNHIGHIKGDLRRIYTAWEMWIAWDHVYGQSYSLNTRLQRSLIISWSSCFQQFLAGMVWIQEGTYYWHMSDAMVLSRPQSWRDLYLRLQLRLAVSCCFHVPLEWLRLSIVMGVPPRWMVYFMENPTKMDDDWG